ncbi:MAG TPA: von Willebrand factor type A domain-containing protein, partial [Steroidobacteraceae bacterium]|nr:von Willebrand factor type A domain-containing protein [Steroidobacteraceae bacterium]
MNTQSFERQLQTLDPPAPDPHARMQARRAALEEFDRVRRERESARSRWPVPKAWLGGFATACLLVVGASLYWLMPASERAIAPRPTVRPVTDAAPSPATTPSTAEVPATATRPATPLSSKQRRTSPAAAPVAVAESQAAGARALARTAAPAPAPAAAAPGVAPASPVPPPAVIIAQTTVEPSADLQLAEVQVSGTRILAPNVTSANPVTSISAAEAQRLGIVNVADALTTLVPQNISTYAPTLASSAPAAGAPAAGGAAPAGGGGDSYFVGNTIANLRGLDPTFGTRTLTLVDGSRVPSTSNQADVVDLNTIPANLLDRTDVVTGGASATYGSGAMAGVVNQVLNRPAYGMPQPAAAVTANDKFEQFAINPVKRAADEPVSTFSLDVDTASYSFVRRQLNEGRLPPAGAVRTEEMINYFDYDWPAADAREQPFMPTITVSDSPWGQGKKLVHIGIKGYELPARQRPDVNLVLLLDVSGSMNEPDKLPLAQRSMALLLDSLKPTDTVGIAVYAGAAGEVLPPTPVSQKDTILRALYSLRPGGSTAGAAGIQLAYQMAMRNFRKEGVNRVLLATDGDFNVGISGANDLKHFVEQQRQQGIFLSVLGFGEDNYRDDVAQALAQNGNGVAAYIDTLNEARKVLVEQAGAQLFTIAKDVKVQVEFNPATVAEYRLVGYETRALARADFNNDRIDAGDVGAGHTVTAIYEVTPADSAAQLVDGLRYGRKEQPPAADKTGEYGYLKIRYKLPGSDTSQLIQTPISVKAGVPRALRHDVDFSTA